MSTFTLNRASHTATIIDEQLYVLGGGYSISEAQDKIIGKQFYRLSFSEPFFLNTQSIPWEDLTDKNIVPSNKRSAAVANGTTIILFGGQPIDPGDSMAIIYTFDTTNLLWNIPKITGDYIPLNKSSLVAIKNR